MTPPRLDLRLTAAERLAFERAAGSLSVPAWARAVLCATAGLTAMPRKRGADVVPRKRRAGKVPPDPARAGYEALARGSASGRAVVDCRDGSRVEYYADGSEPRKI